LSWCVKVNTLGRLCDNNLERSYNPFTTTNVYFIGAAYNPYFLIIYKPLSLIISPQTFSMQLGAGTAWFCLSQCAILFCTLLMPITRSQNRRTSMTRGKKHSNKSTLKEVRPEKIQTFYNQRGNRTGSIQTRASRRMGHTRCFQ